jgi:type IV pilus assembly protein PilY1
LDAIGQYYEDDQPWKTMSSDPDQAINADTKLACRQAYTILTTDGFWNGSLPQVGEQDNAPGPSLVGPNEQNYTYNPVPPYADASANTLADVAMKSWKTDLRSDIANEVPINTEDPAFWQHMVTFNMGMGFTPTGIQPSGTTIEQIFQWANGGKAIDGFSWPTPSQDSIFNIADLAHAAVNGHGGFYSATNPESFAEGLKNALKRASSRIGTGASLSANSTQTQIGTVVYHTYYYTVRWAGDLKAFNIDAGVIAPSANWSAASMIPVPASRNLWTYNGTDSIAFKLESGNALPALSSAQLSALGGSASAQADMIAYLSGDGAKDLAHGGGFRTRETALGDIVDSQPIYVAAPDTDLFKAQTFTG